MAHIINAASPDAGQEIGEPTPFVGRVARKPISEEIVLWQEGLLDVFGAPNMRTACPCTFKLSGWVQRLLSSKEFLWVFDIPLDMDVMFLDTHCKCCIHSLLHWAITPLVVAAIFCALWTHTGGVDRDVIIIQQELTEHTTWGGAQDTDRESKNKDKLSEVKLSKAEIKEEKEETSNLLEEISKSMTYTV